MTYRWRSRTVPLCHTLVIIPVCKLAPPWQRVKAACTGRVQVISKSPNNGTQTTLRLTNFRISNNQATSTEHTLIPWTAPTGLLHVEVHRFWGAKKKKEICTTYPRLNHCTFPYPFLLSVGYNKKIVHEHFCSMSDLESFCGPPACPKQGCQLLAADSLHPPVRAFVK